MNKGIYYTLACVIAAALVETSSAAAAPPLAVTEPGLRLEYPRDHGAHPESETEWWYFTGHLESGGRTFGFQLTFFRVAIHPEAVSVDSWGLQSVYLGHFAITDDIGKHFEFREKVLRDSLAMAGSSTQDLDVWLGAWSAKRKQTGEIVLNADDEGLSIKLDLRPEKPLVLHGENGFSKKGPEQGEASYYSSFSRMTGSGELSLRGKAFSIDNVSVWMDHEFGSSRRMRDLLGWDWFALQLSDGSELMVYQLRKSDGTVSPFSSGTFIPKEGAAVPLMSSDFTVTAISSWVSPATGIRYPSRWRITAPRQAINVTVRPTVDGQELDTKASTRVRYWEGRCLVEGTAGATPVTGNAYTELVGYKVEK